MDNYVIYRLPDEGHCIFLFSHERPMALDSLEELNGKEGYVIAPFSPEEGAPLLLLQPEYRETLAIRNPNLGLVGNRIGLKSGPYEREEYASLFGKFHLRLQSGDLQKVVVARCSHHQIPLGISPEDLFMKACQFYPHAFVALFSTEESGVWLTATPEVLLAGNGAVWRTMALAGTMPAIDGESPHWSDKDIAEQGYVTSHLRTCLSHFARQIEEDDPYTVQAANLLHLRSDFRFCLEARDQLGDFLGELHPTPAVCGVPEDQALQSILSLEKQSRRYYSGFQGPLYPKNATHLYVTLRCMQIRENCCDLYAGSGLLRESTLEREWQETEMKLGTMRGLLERNS